MQPRLLQFLALPFGALIHEAAAATQLPSLPVSSREQAGKIAANLARDGNWWAHVGDHLYYKPVSFLGLSSEIGSYYCAIGSEAALTDEMKQHRVGGSGRWHIFHLPKGPPASISQKFGNSGDRRASFSALIQLQAGAVMSDVFPAYIPSDSYVNPLDADGQALEKTAVDMVTSDSVSEYLTGLVKFNTRSYNNPDATKEVTDFLQAQFTSMGITNCLHSFQAGDRTLTNVIGVIKGQAQGLTVTLGAHYDSRPYSGNAPGAEDNGSGVASLLAQASAFARAKVMPQKTVYFVAFAGEEPGLLGSKAFATELLSGGSGIPEECRLGGSSFLQVQRVNTAANHKAIIMDEVGWLTKNAAFPKATVNLESYDKCEDVMQNLVHASKTYNGDDLAVVHNGAPFGSDHMSFLDKEVNAVLTINGDDEAYPNYHKATDTIQNPDGSFNVDWNYLARISKMDLGALVRLAGVQNSMVTTA